MKEQTTTAALALAAATGLAASILAAGPGVAGTKDAPPAASKPAGATESAMINHTVRTINGADKALSDYRGQVLLIVNTASECGFTRQYAGLETLYDTYKERGLVVLGFPSNDFGGQEPGTEAEIATFCQVNYGVSFPLFAKVHAKGPEKAPLYKTLTEETPEGIRGEVRWNFTKFLVDTQGQVVARFDSRVEPTSAELTQAVEKLLPR